MHHLEPLLNPRSIAIVGASPKPGSFGGAVLRNLRKHYQGPVYPVNPQYAEVDGQRCYASLQALPQVPDCLGIAVAAGLVPDVLRDAAAAGIRHAIVFSSGFSDLGTDEGRARQAAVVALAKKLGIRLLGPNCTGVVNVHSGATCNILPSIVDLPMQRGDVAVIGQSGALGYVVLQAMHRGVGFSKLISTGNSSDIDLADLIDYLTADPQTQAIALLFESIPDGGRFVAALERAFQAGTPVVAYKIGTTGSGQKAALSHSGMLAGDSAAYDAVFYRTGVIQVHAFEALLETAVFFARYARQVPRAPGIGILSGSGGSVVMAADKADQYRLPLPEPLDTTKSQLAARLPSFAAIANPADVTAESIRDHSMYQECVEIFGSDPQFASVVVLMPSAHGEAAVTRARALSELGERMQTPLSLVWMNEWYEGIGSRVYDSSTSLAVFRSLDHCMHAHRAWLDYHRRRPFLLRGARETEVDGARLPRVRPQDGVATLSERVSKSVLAAAGIPVSQDRCVDTAQEAVDAAEQIGYPVVVKVESAHIAHKSDVGGVQLNLGSSGEVFRACREIAAACERHCPQAGRVAFSVQPMVPPGIEMIIGARIDPQFGPMVVYGFGGVWVEVLKDVAVSQAPVTSDEVHERLGALKMFPLLRGVRGAAPADVAAFVEMVVRVSHTIAANADWISEIDVNPVILHAQGGVAVDALVATATV
jgi:acyl-CoA synthetase (NDP forming)